MPEHKPTIIVCGLGRSGSSLVMRMLHAGGMPVFASEEVLFETMYATRPVRQWLHHAQGMAVKILDPVRFGPWPPPSMDHRFIWIQRDFIEQARSHLKLQRRQGMVMSRPRQRVKHYTRQLQTEHMQNLARVIYPSMSFFQIQFEELLANPVDHAKAIADYVGPEHVVDADRMAAQVIARDPRCMEGFLETTYIKAP